MKKSPAAARLMLLMLHVRPAVRGLCWRHSSQSILRVSAGSLMPVEDGSPGQELVASVLVGLVRQSVCGVQMRGRTMGGTNHCVSLSGLTGKVPLSHWAARGVLRCLDPSVLSLVEGGMDDRREPRRQVLFCTSWSSITSSRNHSAAAVIPVTHIPCNVRTATVDKSRKSACKFPTPVYY